jgi:hypothetical protein
MIERDCVQDSYSLLRGTSSPEEYASRIQQYAQQQRRWNSKVGVTPTGQNSLEYTNHFRVSGYGAIAKFSQYIYS